MKKNNCFINNVAGIKLGLDKFDSCRSAPQKSWLRDKARVKGHGKNIPGRYL